MASFPIYEPDQVRARPVADNPRTGVPASAFGDGGKALGQAANALGDTADALAKQQDQQDETAARQIDIEYSARVREHLWGENGVNKLNGRDYLNAVPQVTKDLDSASEEFLVRAKTGQQQRLFSDVIARRKSAWQQDIASRQTQAVEDDNKATASASVDNNIQTVSASYADPAAYADNLRHLEGALLDQRQAYGYDAAVLALKRRQALTTVNTTVVTDLLTKNRPADASARLEDALAKGELDAGVAVKLRGDIATAQTQSEAQGIVGVINMGGAIPDAVRAQAKAGGVDENTAMTVLLLENRGMDPAIKNPKSSAHGLFQITTDTWGGLGGGDRASTPRQIELGIKNLAQTNAALKAGLGRAPAPWETYLGHQQGPGGALKLLKHPDALAVDVVGRDEVLNNGGRLDMTAAQFAGKWRDAYARTAAAAAAMTGGGDIDLGKRLEIAKAYAGGDPDKEKAYTAAVTNDYAMSERVKTEQQKTVAENVWKYAETATSESAIPAPLWNALTPQQRDGFRTQINSNATGHAVKTKPETYDFLYSLAEQNPEAFKKADLLAVTGDLSAADFQEFRKLQHAAVTGVGEWKQPTASYAAVRRVAQFVAPPAFITKANKDQLNAFQRLMFDAVQVKQARQKEPLSDDDIESIGARLSTDVVTGSGMLGDKKRPLYEFDVQGNRAVGVSEIPETERSQVVTALKKRDGRQPSNAEVLKTWRTLKAIGQFDGG